MINQYHCGSIKIIDIIEDHKSLMKVGPPKKIKVEKVQSQEISKLRNFYAGKSLSPESCL